MDLGDSPGVVVASEGIDGDRAAFPLEVDGRRTLIRARDDAATFRLVGLLGSAQAEAIRASHAVALEAERRKVADLEGILARAKAKRRRDVSAQALLDVYRRREDISPTNRGGAAAVDIPSDGFALTPRPRRG